MQKRKAVTFGCNFNKWEKTDGTTQIIYTIESGIVMNKILRSKRANVI